MAKANPARRRPTGGGPAKRASASKGGGGKGDGRFTLAADAAMAMDEAGDAHKFEVTREEPPVPPFEDLGELAESYGTNTLFLIARDPHWLFSYWDIDWTAHPVTGMRDGEWRVYLRVVGAGGEEEAVVEVNPSARNWYLPAARAGREYRVELGYHDPADAWVPIARSNPATTPAADLGPAAGPAFATVPFGVAFHRLLDVLKDQMQPGEGLAAALVRLEQQGQMGPSAKLSAPQRDALAAVLGVAVSSPGGLDSGEYAGELRQALHARLGSESASELMARGWHVGELSSMASALFAKWWKPGQLSGLFSAAGAWAPGVGGSSAAAWFPGFSGAASLGRGVSSAMGAAAAGGATGGAAWGSAMGFGSWFGALGAWGSEVTSGFGVPGASWSAQPFGERRERGFFMHVNAEVTFYGGTHPDARVWINEEPIRLRPDGGFRYHFRFPDGDYEIRIVAESPDGVERRSATLEFRRATGRQGEIGHTTQPPGLAEPLGAKAR